MALSVGEIEAVLKLRDEMSAKLREATGVLNKFEGGTKSANERLKTFGAGAVKIGGALTAGITAPIIAVGLAAAKLGMDAVESESLVSVSFGEMAGAANEWSKGLSKNLGLNQYETRKMSATLFTMSQSMGLSKEASFEMSTGIVQLAADMSSFRNIPMEEALVKIRAGLVGEAEPLKAIGILVNEATIKTYAYTNGIAKQGEELSDQQKVLARYGAILQQTSKDQGDLARTIQSPTNQLRKMKTQITEATTELGMALIPIITQVIGAITQLVPYIQASVKWFSELDETTKILIVGVTALIAAIPPLIVLIGMLALAMAALNISFLPVTATILAVVGVIAALYHGFKQAQIVLRAFGIIAEETPAAIDSTTTAVSGLTDQTAALTAATGQVVPVLDAEAERLAEVAATSEAAAEAQKKAKEAAEEMAEAQKVLTGYTISYEDTLKTVDAELRKEIETYLHFGAGIGEIAKAYPKLSEAQLSAISKGIDAQKKAVEQLAKDKEAVVSLEQSAHDAILALDADTLANRLKHLDIQHEREQQEALASIENVKEEIAAIIAIEQKFNALSVAEYRKASDEKGQIILAGGLQLAASLKANSEAELTRTMTALQKEIHAIQVAEKEKIAAFAGTNSQRAAYEDSVRKGSAQSRAALLIDNDALNANSIQHFTELAAIARATYEKMAADPHLYSEETIEAFKKIAEEAEKQVGRIGVEWKQGFVKMVKAVPGILTQAFTGGGGIAGAMKGIGVMVGAQLGENLGKAMKGLGDIAGPIGSAIGSLAGPIISFFGKMFDKTAKAIKKLGNKYGVLISDEMAKAVKQTMKSEKLSAAAATVFNATKLFPTVDTSNIAKALRITSDAFEMVRKNQLSVAQAGKVVDAMFIKMQEVATNSTGLISKGLLEIIRLNDKFGTNSAAIGKFVTDETTKALDGLISFLSIGATAYDTLTQQQLEYGELTKQLAQADIADRDAILAQMDKLKVAIATQGLLVQATAISSQGAATAMTGAIVASFVSLQKHGMSVTEALKAVQPAITAMETQLKAAGLSGTTAFIGLQKMAALAGHEIAGPALDAVSGLNAAMKGLHNAGLMDEQMFAGLSGQIASTFQALVAQGHDGRTAMQLMQPSLQTIWQLQKDFGYVVDEGTQALIDQAVQAGVVGAQHESVERRILDVLERIAKVLGADIPNAMRDAQDAAEVATEHIQDSLDDLHAPAFEWDWPSPPSGWNPESGDQGYAHGGIVRGYAAGTDSVRALLTPGEAVLTTGATRTLGATAINQLNSGGSLNNDAVINELRLLRKQQAASDRQLPLLVALSVRDAMQLNR